MTMKIKGKDIYDLLNKFELPNVPCYLHEFDSGHFVVQKSHGSYNKLSTDQALEHMNRAAKVAGGLTGLIKSEGARDRWCLTYTERCRLTQETCSIYDVKVDDPEYWTLDYHKYISKLRIIRDENNVKKLVEQLQHFRVFAYHNQNLVCILHKVHKFNSTLISR